MFAKVFEQIFTSSISRDYVVRHVFMDLLVLANVDGDVDMTTDAIARVTNVPESTVKDCIAELMKPDSSSRTPDHDGRRLILLDEHRDWGWNIVNYRNYAKLRDEEARREYFREAKRKQRAKNVQDKLLTKLDPVSVCVSVSDSSSEKSARETRPPANPMRFNSTEAAQGYCHTFHVSGAKNYDLIREAIEAAAPGDPLGIANAMIEARTEYEGLKGKSFEYNAVAFITSGVWARTEAWKGSNGKKSVAEAIRESEREALGEQ